MRGYLQTLQHLKRYRLVPLSDLTVRLLEVRFNLHRHLLRLPLHLGVSPQKLLQLHDGLLSDLLLLHLVLVFKHVLSLPALFVPLPVEGQHYLLGQLRVLLFVLEVVRKVLVEQGRFHHLQQLDYPLSDNSILQDVGDVQIKDLLHVVDSYLD